MSYARFRQQLLSRRSELAENLVVLPRVDSTNSMGRRVVQRLYGDYAEPQALLLVGYEQTDGRGRQGRSWESNEGLGAYVSCLVPMAAADATSRLTTLPLLAGIAMARAVDGILGGERARLKWPNDVLVEDRKIGGILIETLSNEDGDVTAVVGCGLNVGHGSSELPTPQATSLRQELTGEPASTADAVVALASSLDRELARAGQMAPILDDYRALSAHAPGDHLRCRMGGEVIEGEFQGFGEGGVLHLNTSDGTRVLSSGEIVESFDPPSDS